MARMDSYVEYTLELLEPLGPVQARRMFGGWGLHHAGRMMGLIIEDRLYLKTDDTTRPVFEAAGGEPFAYDADKRRKTVITSYWTPPADVSDDAHALLPWARRAVEAALRAAQKQKKPTAKKPAPAKAKAKTTTPKQARTKKPAVKKPATKKSAAKKTSRRA